MSQVPLQPPGQQPPGQYGSPPPNYLVQAILTTLFCCLPAGVVAIIFAAQVNSKYAAGDVQGAMQSSKNAKTWSWVALGLGIAAIVLYIILLAAGAATFEFSTTTN